MCCRAYVRDVLVLFGIDMERAYQKALQAITKSVQEKIGIQEDEDAGLDNQES